MKHLIFTVSLFFFAQGIAQAQPRYLGTDITGSYQTTIGNMYQNMISVRQQAAASSAAGTIGWEFIGANSLLNPTTQTTTLWRPVRQNAVVPYNALTLPTLLQPSAITQVNNGGYIGRLPAVTSGNYYTFNADATQTGFEGYKIAVIESKYAPITLLDTAFIFTTNCKNTATPPVTLFPLNNDVRVSVRYNTAPNRALGERVYLAYSTDLLASFTIVEMTQSSQSATYVFAANTLPRGRISCYAFTTDAAVSLTEMNANSINGYLYALSLNINRLVTRNGSNTVTSIVDRYHSFTTVAPAAAAVTYGAGAYAPCIVESTLAASTKIVKLTTPLLAGSTYAWSGAVVDNSISPNENILGSLEAGAVPPNGVYSVAVTNAAGCISTGSYTIAFNPFLKAVQTQLTSPGNCGLQTGTIGYVGSGGIPLVGASPYTYKWSTGTPLNYPEGSGNTNVIAAIGGSVHTVTITDAVGCTVTTSAVISTLPAIPAVDLASVKHIQCKGQDNGQIAIRIKGGSPFAVSPYLTLAWANGNPTVIANAGVTWTGNATAGYTATTPANLKPGLYSVTITGSGGCKDIMRITVLEAPSLPSVRLTQAPACYKNGTRNTGLLKAVPTGGAPNSNYNSTIVAYRYAWSAYNTTPAVTRKDTLMTLTYGSTYTVTITDAYGCTATNSATIDSTSFDLTAGIKSVPSCFNGRDGQAFVNYAPKEKPVFITRFVWSAVPTSSYDTIKTLVAGVHTVYATFINGCISNTDTVTMANGTALLNLTMSSTPSNGYQCITDRNGSVNVSVNGGLAPYTYAWQANSTIVGNASTTVVRVQGNIPYIVTVTSTNGCSATQSVMIAAPTSAVSPSAAIVPVRCKGENNGTIRVSLSGNIANPSYQWYDNNVLNTSATVSDRVNNLNGGVYGIIVTDPATGCKGYIDAIVDQPATVLTASASISQNVVCFGGNTGKACIAAAGGAGDYVYKWSAIRDSACVLDLEVGSYSPTVTDKNGCSIVTAPITITGPSTPIIVGLTVKNKACGTTPNGVLCVTNVQYAARPYTYLWNDSNTQTDSCATGLSSGGYIVTVTDKDGCTSSANLTIPSVALILTTRDAAVEKGKTITPFVECNVDADQLTSISWVPPTFVSDPTELVPTLSPPISTNYVLTISKDGCTIKDTISIIIREKDGFRIAVPTGFSPGSDGPDANNYFRPILNETFLTLTAFRIYNKWGQLVYDNLSKPGWDGTLDGALQPAGAYVYMLEYKDDTGNTQQMSGDIVLVR